MCKCKKKKIDGSTEGRRAVSKDIMSKTKVFKVVLNDSGEQVISKK